MKRKRQEKIIELIAMYDVETQEELADLLEKNGFRVTQATVSRDIREMKLSKISDGKGRQKYVALTKEDSHLGDKFLRVLQEGFVSMDMAQNILVVKTVSGMAMAVAAAIDAMRLSEIVGSIAGYDSFMIAVSTAEDTKLVMEQIENAMRA